MLPQRPSAVFLILPAYSLIATPIKSGSNRRSQNEEAKAGAFAYNGEQREAKAGAFAYNADTPARSPLAGLDSEALLPPDMGTDAR
jgi:hypothetical protein